MASIHPRSRPPDADRAARVDAGAFEPDTSFGERFRIVRKLASGGGGHVYEALNIWTNRRVALKLMRPERSEERAMKRRFQFEAEAATRVMHPNVVEVIASGRDPETGLLFLVQEFLDGVDLEGFLKETPRLDVAQAMAVLAPVMRALRAAHERGVIHRDLKPENIFLARSPDGGVIPKVIDFGIARLLSDPVRLTEKGMVNGTPSYMSPEQVRGDADIDERTDVWSVAVIWYELLAGRTPFRGGDFRELFDSILGDEPDELESVAPGVPPALAGVIHRALSKPKEQRFATMAAFLDALTMAAEPTDDAPKGDEPELTLVAPRPSRAPPSRRPKARSRAWRVLLPLGLLLAISLPGAWRVARPLVVARLAARRPPPPAAAPPVVEPAPTPPATDPVVPAEDVPATDAPAEPARVEPAEPTRRAPRRNHLRRHW